MSEVITQALHVVAREVNNELNDARVSLELFGEQQEDVALLIKCREHLRQVRGALRLVEVFGAALLVEEMEQLAQYLIDNLAEKRHLAEGLDALMRAMVQLPTYLERVLSGGRDMALVLLPLLNDLRAVRGNPLLSEGTLLLLNLSSDKSANPIAPANGEPTISVSQWARKMRTRFQLGLLGWIKGERVDQNLEILARAAEKLEQIATTQSVFQLWWVVGAIVEALRNGGLEGTASVKRLLGQADREMRRLYEQGEQKYCEKPPLDLLNNLLYYVARATNDGARVAAVRASFRLHELLPIDRQVEAARESLSAPSIKLMKTVATAIKEDLARVKDALDIFVRKGGSQLEELAPQLDLLKKIGDTLGVLGLGELRERVQRQTADLQKLLNSQASVDDTVLLAMASTLINVEDNLDEQLVGLIMPVNDGESSTTSTSDKDTEFRQVSEAVLRECIVNMARIKEAIALALEKPGEAQALEQIPHLIRGITAGLLMLGKSRAVEVTERIRKSLAKYARPEVLPKMADRIDRLADAIVAVEYYLETLQAGRSDPWYMLDNAESCLRVLEELSSGNTGVYRIPENLEPSTSRSNEPVEATLALTPAERLNAAAQHDGERTEVLRDATLPVLTETRVVSSSDTSTHLALPPVLLRPSDKSDPEFLELFIEEAREEIAKLQSLLPHWDDNPQDIDALTHVRRSFHTLKGSGRLVGAQLIGEFAWSMESMLNRVINKTMERTPDMMELLRQGVATLPELVEQLEAGRQPSQNVGTLIAKAQVIAGTQHTPRSSSTITGAVPIIQAARRSEPKIEAAAREAQANADKAAVDPTLHDIFAKEVAGHLAAIREYIGSCRHIPAPYPVTEALHRACHTLNGASKAAGVRHSIKIAEPLNHYVRKLFDNGANLPGEGLSTLEDSVNAIESVLGNITESTAFFGSQDSIVARLKRLEERLDSELTSRGMVSDATGVLLTPAVVFEESGMTNRMPRIDPPPTLQDSSDSYDVTHVELESNEASAADHQSEAAAITATPDGDTDDEEWINLTVDDLQALVDTPIPELLAHATPPDANTQSSDAFVSNAASDGNELFVDETMQSDATQVPVEIDTEPQVIVETSSWAANFAAPVLEDVVLESSSQDAEFQPSIAEDSAATGFDIGFDNDGIQHDVNGDLEGDTNIVLVGEPESWMQAPPGAAPVEVPYEAAPYEALPSSVLNAHPDADTLSEAPVSPLQSLTQPAQIAAAVAQQPPLFDATLADVSLDDLADDDFDADVAAIFTEEATELLELADISLSGWQGDRSNPHYTYELKRALHTLKGGARMAGIRAMGDLSHELESFMEQVELGGISASPAVFEMMQASLDELHRMRDVVSQGRNVKVPKQLMARIRSLAHGETPPAAPAFSEQVAPAPAPEIVQEIAQEVWQPSAYQPMEQTPQTHHNVASLEHDLNADLSSASLSPQLQEFAAAQFEAPVNQFAHTEVEFGGEELTQMSPMPMFAPPTEATIDFELDALNGIGEMPLPEAPLPLEPSEALPEVPIQVEWQSIQPENQVEAVEAQAVFVATPPSFEEAVEESAQSAAPAPAVLPGREQQAQERGEVARVDAELLDTLLNNAGEVSILRSRLEQQVTSVEFNLTELNRTVTRLKDQLRNLELETEAQILHKHQEDARSNEEFDPLELDRYSTIQQLSRALAESVSDVASIEGLLENMTRETQNLLLQQARVVTELQNGLMRTRMVPFSRHVQRLTRLVRQVAGETGKRAELVVAGGTGELDRQVLERMLPPFEHMLRNSVVHGIETPAERVQAGKPESGTISVNLHREGAEMVITLQDDGRGIDVNAVREKAKAKGLIPSDRVLTDEEAMQLILEPGFSTATKITQHAGRGVGMDVVVNEIKKLGGALFTESKFGHGVKFTIRLPFTLAISQSLLVRVGEHEMYALPLPSVEGVVRLPRLKVESHLHEAVPSFKYGDQVYKFQHLGSFIDGAASELPDDADTPVPVILVKAGEHSTALVTDELVGNREIVVKSVGPQISSIRGIAGATILGDGRVVIILDMGALVRSEWRARPDQLTPRGEDRRTVVLVVDDSITVRRVTQRLLERNGMRVLAAKDGVDALEILQEHVPDIILLDIEMPRMDGYELATQVRGNARLADIPIVMITSRVGEKHRARAIEIGVNDYLGKPYQENQLLDAIEPLVQARRRKTG